MLPEEWGSGQELVLLEENKKSGSIQTICIQNHEDKNKTLTETRINVGESDYPTEESKNGIYSWKLQDGWKWVLKPR